MAQTTLVSVVVKALPGKTADGIAQAAMMMSLPCAKDPPLVNYVALGTMSSRKHGSPAPSGMFRLSMQLCRPTWTKTLLAKITIAIKQVAKVYGENGTFDSINIKWPVVLAADRGIRSSSGTRAH
ncbi:hypothetical protein JKP88DRAFT_255150 [Tribonema minus]|uniref:Uncharacterized protein n=1 Tax=Tribonema minus TaxID=303371 RepID=A0A835Z4T7_9STRA|nr:hypothetical protein JKP88DRAFT_255150 [Tribonema minus]